ncbi:MAG TPA: metallopeptidase family protein [Candidatus Saccharimonadales bacterium]|jgi:predicted Zn-dependent protease with MMP-like domain
MLEISDEQFEDLIGQALDELPKEYVSRLLKDVAVTWQDDPTPEQRTQLKLRGNQTLFGLYEGLPLPQRYNGYGKITPDKITIFKNPICNAGYDMHTLKEQIKHTVWHEMAHYFGLDHKRIHELE